MHATLGRDTRARVEQNLTSASRRNARRGPLGLRGLSPNRSPFRRHPGRRVEQKSASPIGRGHPRRSSRQLDALHRRRTYTPHTFYRADKSPHRGHPRTSLYLYIIAQCPVIGVYCWGRVATACRTTGLRLLRQDGIHLSPRPHISLMTAERAALEKQRRALARIVLREAMKQTMGGERTRCG